MSELTNNTSAPVVIIGYGTAGTNALIALRTSGYKGEVSVFSDTDTRPYSPILTSYFAGGMKSFDECFPWSAAELDALHADVHANCPVRSIDFARHTVATAQGTFPYSKCIIATGATPMAYGFPKTSYRPYQLRTMGDAARMKEMLESPASKHVLVSGASMVALKTVEACLAQGKQVTLVGMNDHVLDMNALPVAAERFEGLLRNLGVTLKLGTTIQAVEAAPAGSEGKLKVSFANGDEGCFDEICVSHGMKSNLDFIAPGALEFDRALLVDEFMRTSNPDVYAVGDVAQAKELISGERRVVGIWKNAAVQGAIAGRAIATELAGEALSEAKAYQGSFSHNTITVQNALFISAGTIHTTEKSRIETREEQGVFVVYLYEDNRLVGFNLVTDNPQEGGPAFDIGAMLTLRIEAALTA